MRQGSASHGRRFIVEVANDVNGFDRGIDDLEQIGIIRIDKSFLDKKIEIHNPVPICLAEKNYWDLVNLLSLHKGQHVEDFVKCSKSSRKGDERFSTQQEMHFTQAEIPKLKTKLG